MEKWNEQDYLKFIRLYEEHPCLWNTDLPEHKNGASRKRAIKTIIAKMDIPNFGEHECRNKIKRVRTAYGIEVKCIEASEKHGRVYKTSLAWFGAVDKFLRNHLEKNKAIKATQGPRAKRTATEVNQEVESEQAEQTNSGETSEDVENSETPIVIKCEDLFEEEPTKFIKPDPPILFSSQDDRETKRRRDDACNSEDVKPLMEVSDEFMIFGQSVAAQLKAMPKEDALQLQEEIQQLISKKRVKIEDK